MSTHEPLTQERLDAIQERVDKATKGRWDYAVTGKLAAWDGNRAAPVIDFGKIYPEDAEFIIHAREDVPALLAEVERLRHFESIVSWRHGDTTDERTREDMVERAKRAFGAATAQVSSIPLGMSEDMFIDSVGLQHQHAIRAALDAALGTGEGT